MATVYFVREGSGNGRTNQGRELSLAEIVKAFPNYEPNWSQEAPVFNPNSPANPVSAYRFVVVQVKSGECAGRFTKDGYWFLKGLSPTEFDQKFACA